MTSLKAKKRVPFIVIILIAVCIIETTSQHYADISPNGTIYVAVGQEEIIDCILDQSQLGIFSSHDMGFRVNNKPHSVIVVDNSTIRMSTMNWTAGTYLVECTWTITNDVFVIRSKNVFIGYPPFEVTNFQCITYNLEYMTCTWDNVDNPVRTTFNLLYYSTTNGSLSVIYNSCSSANSTACNIEEPQYEASDTDFHFVMNATNALGTRVQNLSVFYNYEITIPGPMEDLDAANIGKYSADISWSVPWQLFSLKPGLIYRLTWTINAPWSDAALNYIDTSDVNPNAASVSMTVDLPYPYTDYTISVGARSSVADDRFWSETVSISLRTAPSRPCAPPIATLGSFSFSNYGSSRNITLHWSPLEPYCVNGPGAGYLVQWFDMSGSYDYPGESVNVSQDNLSAQFTDLNANQNVKFVILSFNDEGFSADETEIFVPKSAVIPNSARNVKKIAYDGTFYEIQWNAPAAATAVNSMSSFVRDYSYEPSISSYTVFWCQSTYDNPVVCNGPLGSQTVAADQLSVNITDIDPRKNYQFAVGVNQGDYGSGLVWSDCAINAYSTGSRVDDKTVVALTNNSMDLRWSLPCSKQNGIVLGFNIDICSVGDDAQYQESSPCIDETRRLTAGPDDNRISIKDLASFTWYKVSVTTQMPFGPGPTSTALFNRTSEGVPTPPFDLDPTEVTNHSIAISWKPPTLPNGNDPTYTVYLNGKPILDTSQTETVLDGNILSYENYSIAIRACHILPSPLCSELSDAISIRTKIGVPSRPLSLDYAMSSSEPSKVNISWSPPNNPAGALDMYYIGITYHKDDTVTLNVSDVSITYTIDTDSCPFGKDMNVVVRAVNRNEDNQPLMSDWTPAKAVPCPNMGLKLSHIIAIGLSVACLVLLIAIAAYMKKRHEVKETARNLSVTLPWSSEGKDAFSAGQEPVEEPPAKKFDGRMLESQLSSSSCETSSTSADSLNSDSGPDTPSPLKNQPLSLDVKSDRDSGIELSSPDSPFREFSFDNTKLEFSSKPEESAIKVAAQTDGYQSIRPLNPMRKTPESLPSAYVRMGSLSPVKEMTVDDSCVTLGQVRAESTPKLRSVAPKTVTFEEKYPICSLKFSAVNSYVTLGQVETGNEPKSETCQSEDMAGNNYVAMSQVVSENVPKLILSAVETNPSPNSEKLASYVTLGQVETENEPKWRSKTLETCQSEGMIANNYITMTQVGPENATKLPSSTLETSPSTNSEKIASYVTLGQVQSGNEPKFYDKRRETCQTEGMAGNNYVALSQVASENVPKLFLSAVETNPSPNSEKLASYVTLGQVERDIGPTWGSADVTTDRTVEPLTNSKGYVTLGSPNPVESSVNSIQHYLRLGDAPDNPYTVI